MNKITRTILLIIAASLFIGIAPVVVLYAVGYRFPASLLFEGPFFIQPESVGVLLLESIPGRASVWVDGNSIGTTPEAAANLNPGFVRVKVTKEGYGDWEKTIEVSSGRAIQFRSIRLFASNPRIDTIAASVETFSLSPARVRLAAVDENNRLHIVDQDGLPEFPPVSLKGSVESLLWSPDDSAILISYKNNTMEVIDMVGQTLRTVPIPAQDFEDQVVWDPRTSGQLLGRTPQGQVIAYPVAGAGEQVLTEEVIAFAPSRSRLYVATTTGTIDVYTLRGRLSASIETSSFSGNAVSLSVTPDDVLAVQDEGGGVWILEEDNRFVLVTDQADQISWSPDGQILLVQTALNELHVYNQANKQAMHIPRGQLHLVVRLSRPIRHAEWFAGSQHVMYQLDDEIIITEIDTRDYPVSNRIDTTNTGDAKAAVGEEGSWLYYIKRENGSSALVRASLLLAEDL